ncbi:MULTISPECIES: hypothetical protein [Alloalcanivorax]|uniref:hypothetical protein n=1 Tax=Alloalcanivorax TaxID=3020832 RepID=UPI0003B82ECB|nr:MULTISPECIES: hypothetical protein [Alloalcanivorax]ERS13892.1 hypothetical protein Q668_12555 [Alcanivorax sp. PN-3]GGJ84110.1 hypothetical protein GCM10007426_11520 [Alloalcanivorax dieselolei]
MTLDTTLSITIAMSMMLALVITKAAVSGWWRAPETWIVGLPVIAGILCQVIWPNVFSLFAAIIILIVLFGKGRT